MVGVVMVAAWIAACSGSDEQEVITAPDSGQEAGFVDTNRPDVQTDTSRPDTGPPDTGPIYDAGPPTVLDGGALYEGGVPCVVGGALEEEPNDDKDAANTMAPTRCGVVLLTADGGALSDGGVAESDFLTFQLKPATTSFYIQFTGNVMLKITVGAQTATFTPAMQEPVPFDKTKPYYIEVKSFDTKRANWRVTVFEM